MTRRGGRRGMLNPNSLLQQVQQMQADLERIQAEAEQEEVVVTAGGGAVEVVITGGLEVKRITLKEEVIDPDDPEMLQDLLVAAVNEAITKARAMVAERMSSLTAGLQGLGIPGL